jgi:hypothetical protein
VTVEDVMRAKVFFYTDQMKVNFFEAMEYCVQNGMRPASIKTAEENVALKERIKQVNTFNVSPHPSITTGVWTGGNDLGHEMHFNWMVDGSAFNYTSWDAGEPNNGSSKRHNSPQNCVQVFERNGQLVWDDDQCHVRKFVACEYYKVTRNTYTSYIDTTDCH